jgi:RNA polymerase sigma-70 factor (ECF subfamily)
MTVQTMVLNSADTDDLTQEIFLRAFRGLSHFHGKAEFSTWLYRITMNVTRTFLDQRTRSRTASTGTLLDDSCAPNDPADKAAMRAEFSDDVTIALGELSVSLRAAIVLSIQGLSVKEAATAEGCNVATMYWRLHQARKTLGQRLKKHLEL